MKKLFAVFFFANFFIVIITFAQTSAVLSVGSDYKATKVLENQPISNFFTFDFEGNYIFAQNTGGITKIVKTSPAGESKVLVERVSQPILGLSFHGGKLYVIFRGRIDVYNNGALSDVVTGLPAGGDYANGAVIFNDGKMYFGIGTATNSGLVGADNGWLRSQPSVHDLLCRSQLTNQVNIETDNFLTEKKGDKAVTGAFMSFNTKAASQTQSGSGKCNGAIMRANPDGSNLELVAYGFHNPKGISFDAKNNLYTLDSAMEDRGVRPVKDGKDSLFAVSTGTWYGWPDFNAGKQLEKPLINIYPNTPPQPKATFDPGHLSQFVVSQFAAGSGLAIYDSNKIVEFGLGSEKLSDFATLPSGYKVDQIKFGKDSNLYILVSNGKTSELWKIESTKYGIGGLSTSGVRTLPIAWSISLSVMAIGLVATYLVYKNRQEPII